jgi:anti-anti-sigma regulatory factor
MSFSFAVFEIERKTENGIEILFLSGSLNDFAFPKLEGVLMQLQIEYPSRVILDCSKLASVSTQALVRCLSFVHSFRNNGGNLEIAGMPEIVVGYAKALGLEGKIEWHRSRAVAEKALTTRTTSRVAASNKQG